MSNDKSASDIKQKSSPLVSCVHGPECISEHLHFSMSSLGCEVVPSDVYKVAGFVYKRADVPADEAAARHAGLVPGMILCITAPGCQAENVSVAVNTDTCDLVVSILNPDKIAKKRNTILDVCVRSVFNTNLKKADDKESLLEQLDITIILPWTYDLTEVTVAVEHGLIIIVIPDRYAVREHMCTINNSADVLERFYAAADDIQRVCSGNK